MCLSQDSRQIDYLTDMIKTEIPAFESGSRIMKSSSSSAVVLGLNI